VKVGDGDDDDPVVLPWADPADDTFEDPLQAVASAQTSRIGTTRWRLRAAARATGLTKGGYDDRAVSRCRSNLATRSPPDYAARVLGIDWYMFVFRLIHIGAGVAWAGSVFFLVVFVQPSAKAIAPAGAPFIAELIGRRRLVDRLLAMAAVTIVAGLFVYVRDMNDHGGFGDWVATSLGLGLTLGAVSALLAFGVGVFGTRPATMRMLALVRQMAASSGPPEPEVAQEFGRMQARAAALAKVNLTLVAIAVLLMATARYW
jgi:uncharacterized membrane protein